MTNFNSATRSFTLHTEGTESYSWAWEGIDRTQALAEIDETGNDIVAYAHGWACKLCHACISQINEEGERGFTEEEITNDLIDDRHSLANALQAWLEEGDEPTDDQEPQPFGVETAVRLLEEGFVEEGAGIHIARASGHAGGYDISTDSDDRAMYSVVWSHGIVASTQTMNQADVVLLLTDEAQLGSTFYWQTMPNNEWELTNAPVLPEVELAPEPTAPVPTAREMAEQIRSEVEDGWTEVRHAWLVEDYLFVIWDHEGYYSTSIHAQIYKRTATGWVEAEKETIL